MDVECEVHSECFNNMNRALALQVDSLGDRWEGWFDDGVEPYSIAALDWVARILDHLVSGFELPIPYLYPTAQGCVRAGWATPRWDVLADIDLTTHAVSVVAWKASTHELRERKIQLEAPGAESQLGRFLAGHTR
jgi:hypothetical protein